MSPTILRERGYQFLLYTNDHLPPHIHVRKSGHEAVVKLDSADILVSHGYNERELKKICKIVRDNQIMMLTEWDKIHPTE